MNNYNIIAIGEGNITMIAQDRYIGTAKDIIAMLVDWANGENTECFVANRGLEVLDTLHLELSANYLFKACNVIDWLKENGYTADVIIEVEIGEDIHSTVEQIGLVTE